LGKILKGIKTMDITMTIILLIILYTSLILYAIYILFIYDRIHNWENIYYKTPSTFEDEPIDMFYIKYRRSRKNPELYQQLSFSSQGFDWDTLNNKQIEIIKKKIKDKVLFINPD